MKKNKKGSFYETPCTIWRVIFAPFFTVLYSLQTDLLGHTPQTKDRQKTDVGLP